MSNTIKAKRLNLCTVVRAMLIANQISTVKVVNAICSAMGNELQAKGIAEESTKDGDTDKDGVYKVKVDLGTQAYVTTGKASLPLQFDTWAAKIKKAESKAMFSITELPPHFRDWLLKFKSSKEELEKENAEVVKMQ